MKCYLCKAEISEAIRTFLIARNKREKDYFRDLCRQCYLDKIRMKGNITLLREGEHNATQR